MTGRPPTARPFAFAAVLLVLAAALGPAAPGATHGFHVTANPQVSDDGTVVVESLATAADGFVVLHADGGDGPGEPVGHVPVAIGSHAGVEVAADAGFWADVTGNETLLVAIHTDDGDGEFEPGRDPIAAFGGSSAAARVPVRKTDRGRAYVLAGSRPQRAPTPVVYVKRVALAEDGFVVLQAGEHDRTVGHAALDAGVHRLVPVRLNRTFFDAADDWMTLRATVYRDDGDGEFTDRDAPVAVEGRPVASRLTVEKTNGSRVTPTVTTPASSASATRETDTDATPTPGLVTTATPTLSPAATPTAGSASPGAPGFSTVAAVIALAGLALGLGRWR